jgi:hypothetical protein
MADVASAITNVPIPGQSLTTDPDSRAPYEQPPASTKLEGVTQNILNIVSGDEFIDNFARTFNEGSGIFVDKMAGTILTEAFGQGKLTPDLAILAIEPTIEALMFLASTLDVPVRFSSDKDDEDWTGIKQVARIQAEVIGTSSPASLREWLGQNDEVVEKEITPETVKQAVGSLLDAKGAENG